MKGIITNTTKGTVGTKFDTTTPHSVPATPALYSTVASGMPKVIGGTIKGSRNSSSTTRLPGKSRRASAYAAGTPISPASTTTSPTAWNVTSSTSPS